ncbi:MAG: hypothetical protein HZA51_10210 [Planctomycetes bacterium]|nr:hypothetical protein [Planctomycetota bacterium]
MSAIPPNVIGSVLQSGAAQRAQAVETDTARTAQSEAARKAAAGPDAFVEIEATDGDTQVHTDSGGLGSQGRQDNKPEEPLAEDESAEQDNDDTDTPHIDLSA